MKNKGENQEKQQKFGFKPFAFFSGVFDLVIAVTILTIGFLTAYQLFNAADTGNEGLNKLAGIFFMPFIIIIFVIFAIGGILFLVMGILTLISSFRSDKKNWNGLLITVMVFDVLLIGPAIFLIFSTSGTTQIFNIVLLALLVLGFIFKIIDVVLTKKRNKNYQATLANETSFTGPNFDALNKTEEKAEEKKVEPEEKKDDVDFSNLKN